MQLQLCTPLTAAAANQQSRRLVVSRASRQQAGGKTKQQQQQQQQVAYGADWYTATRQASRRSVREEIAFRKEANRAANNGRERKDLYTDNWDGSEYKGSPFNILNVILVISVLTPLAGLWFAFQTYGVLWG